MTNPNTRIEQKGLLIDSSRCIFDKFYYHYLGTINILAEYFLNKRILVNENDFVKDCLNVLISLPSKTFELVEVSNN